MKNPIKKFKEWQNDRKQRERLHEISALFANIEKLEKSGLLNWERRHRRLFIAEPLATIMLAKGAEGWTNFLNNVYLFITERSIQDAWQNIIVVRQGRAVSEAKKKRPSLSAADIQRIKRTVLAELTEDAVPLPKIQAFEFFVVGDSADKNPETTLCGTYDPDTDIFDIVAWEDIKAAVAAGKKEKKS